MTRTIQDWISRLLSGMEGGQRAVITQPYTEVNVKRGLQFEASVATTLAGGASTDIIVQTGSLPIIVKGRDVQYFGEGLSIRLFKSPTYTGGSPIAIYNLTDINPQATTVNILAGVTVTDVGTEIAAPRTFLGDSSLGAHYNASTTIDGLERPFSANSVYLQRITNLDTVAVDIAAYTSWYEGEPDYPLD